MTSPKPTPNRRRSILGGLGCLGCLGLFLGGLLVMAVLAAAVAYWTVMHTSMPLTQLAKLMESTGDVQVEGLSGTVSTGFHIDKLRLRDDSGRWSQLEQVDFVFNGVWDALSNRRLIIDRLAVGKGEIHIDWATGDGASDDTAVEDGTGTPMEDPLAEFAVGEVEITDLTFITDNGDELHVDKVAISDFQYVDGQIRRVGNVIVDCDHFELESQPSQRFANAGDEVPAIRLSGVIRATVHDNLLADIPYSADTRFGAADGEHTYIELLGGRVVQSTEVGGKTTVTFDEVSPADYLKLDVAVPPSRISGSFITEPKSSGSDEETVTIAPGTTFHLGQTRFTVETTELHANDERTTEPVIARHQADGTEIECRLHLFSKSPYVVPELISGDERNTTPLFAETLFATDEASLTDEQRTTISAMQAAVDRLIN